jgi:hypothetical protein
MNQVLGSAISVVVMDRNNGPVDGKLFKVWTAVSVELGVEVGEDAALEQRVFCKVNTSHDVAWLELLLVSSLPPAFKLPSLVSATYHDLLSLGKVIDGICIQSQHTKRIERGILLWDDLGRVKNVESEGESLVFVENLDVELPLWIVARLNGVPEILSVEVGILASNVLGFVPDQAGFPLLGLPVPFDKLALSFVVYKSKRVDSMAVLAFTSMSATQLSLQCCMTARVRTMWRKLLGIPYPAIAQNNVWRVEVSCEKKSHAESWAVAPCGISLSDRGLTE